MIARWMLAAVLFAALCGVAALAAERALRALRWPTRWPWMLALVIGTAWPAIAPFVLTARDDGIRGSGGTVSMQVIPLGAEAPRAPLSLESLETPLLVGWAMASLLLLVQVVLAIRTIVRTQRHANPQDVQGEMVLVDEHMGPAVIGVLRPRVVVPVWLLELDESLRGLILRHEREHCRAGDPGLVWLSVIATTLFPFNAALWWVARRLRLAMEIDCDTRTLRGESDSSRYAKLLLLIAQQSNGARFAPMLSHSTSQLARRIHAMQNPVLHFRPLRVVAAIGVVIGAGAVACSSRIASNMTGPAPAPTATESSTAATSTTATVTAPAAAPTVVDGPYFDFQVEQPASVAPGFSGPRYPDALRAQRVEGTVLAQYVVNADGGVDSTTIRILRSTHQDFTAAVRESIITMRFNPARVGGRAVRQLVQTPFQFSLGNTDAGSVGETRPPQPNQTPATSQPAADPALNREASLKPETMSLRYPDALREARVEGKVFTQFVVNADGTVDMASLKVVRSDHADFTQAVRDALPALRFEPARVNGRAVRQLREVPFDFSLAR